MSLLGIEKSRTEYCGQFDLSYKGQDVVLMGWCDTRRDHGGLIFVDVRDREGVIQVVFDPKITPECKDLRNEDVIYVEGLVVLRPEGMKNKKLSTGEIEIHAKKLKLLSPAQQPPFLPFEENVSEDLRLKYRYLDMRSEKLTRWIRLRHEVSQRVRSHLTQEGFFEVETPILYKSTPEGARDFLVPSRMQPGSFYALPQSPQSLKQLLMIGGIDKYFQLARCFRDEDLRADRQPEFTQIDIEMSFVNREHIMKLSESLASTLWKTFKHSDIGKVPVLTYQQAMDLYGADKPDLRHPQKIQILDTDISSLGFQVFQSVLDQQGTVRGLAFQNIDSFSRSQLDKLTDHVKSLGAQGLVWIKVNEKGDIQSPIKKFLNDTFIHLLRKKFEIPSGPMTIFIVADQWKTVCQCLGFLRLNLSHKLYPLDKKTPDKFCWVVDFPLLEYDPKERRWFSVHHPFTSPNEQGYKILASGQEENYNQVLSQAYDFVCNGNEIAGGSLRIHDPEIQKQVFRALSISEEDMQQRFGFFNEALTYGTPPHGGIAWGFDRLIMILGEADSIRDVIAFPKTTRGNCLMSEAPSSVDNDQLIELNLKLRR